MKRLLLVLTPVLLIVPTAFMAWLLTTENGLRWTYQQLMDNLPVDVQASRVSGRLLGPLSLMDVKYQQDGTVVSINNATLEWSFTALLSGRIRVNQLHLQTVKVLLPVADDTKASSPLVLPEVFLPWPVTVDNLLIEDFSLQQNEEILDIDSLNLSAKAWFNYVEIENLAVNAESFRFQIAGELQTKNDYPQELSVNWQIDPPLIPQTTRGTGRIDGDLRRLLINQEIKGPVQMDLSAQVTDVLTHLRWQANVNANSTNIALLNSQLPSASAKVKLQASGDLETIILKGNAEGTVPNMGPLNAQFQVKRRANSHIEFEKFQLQVAKSETILNARGSWLPGEDGGHAELAMHWQNLRWPLDTSPWFASAIGSGWVVGNLENYQFGLATDRPWQQAPESEWYAAANGNLQGLQFHSLRLLTLGGKAEVNGPLSWSPTLNWNAEGKITDIDPGNLNQQWPGKLSGTLTSNGGLQNDQLAIDFHIHNISGKLRDYPVQLKGEVSWRDEGVDISQLNFRSGSSKLTADGRIAQNLLLDWKLESNNLAELYPLAAGKLTASGNLSGNREAPLIKAAFSGGGLSYAGYAVKAAQGAVSIDLFNWQQIDIHVDAQQVSILNSELKFLQVDADNRKLQINAASKWATLEILANGELEAQAWRGQIQKADIHSEQFGDWGLVAPANFYVDATNLNLETLCWQKNNSSLCSSLARQQDLWLTTVDMQSLPIALINPWLPQDMTIEGDINAKLSASMTLPEQLSATAQLTLSPGKVNYPLIEGEQEYWDYRGGIVDVDVNDKGVTASLEFVMRDSDYLRGEFTLPGANLMALKPDQQPLQAKAQLDIHDLGLFEALIPEVQNFEGEIALVVAANGTLGQPIIDGKINLDKAAFRIPRLGLVVEELSLAGQTDGLQNASFQLNAKSGEGDLAIHGSTLFERDQGWPTTINIKGEEFEASRIPEARVLVSPDITIKIQRRDISVSGNVHIPFAKLQPKDITTAANVSDDAVMVGGMQITEEKWKTTTQVRITLGDRVHFFGYGFDGRFGGNLLLEDEPGQLTKAKGEIIIPEGRYRAYGQRLDVEYGRIIYTGGPLTNPGLDIRSVRRVGSVTAGLTVRGSLSQPRIELFSIPAMGQTDALAYLLYGQPIENTNSEQGATMAKATLALGLLGGDKIARNIGDRFGLDEMRVESSEDDEQASLVIGRYLSPRLYVSYGVGLIEAVNTLTVRYKISDKWQLKGESGEHHGADLLYTIER